MSFLLSVFLDLSKSAATHTMYTKRGHILCRPWPRRRGEEGDGLSSSNDMEENKVEPPAMTPKEAIYAEVLVVISGGKEGVPADGGNLMHFRTKRALAFPNSQAAI